MAGALAAAVALGLFVNQGPDFRRRPVTFRCSGDPPICLAPGYDQHPDRVRAELTPYLEALREIGAPLPRRFEQGRSSDLVGYVSEELALGHVDPDLNEPVGAFMSAYGGYTCRTYDDRRLNESWDGLNSWLKAVGGNRYVLDFPGLPEVLRTGSKEEQAAWLRNAIDRLRRCA